MTTTTTHDTNAVDGSWALSDAVLSVLRRTFGDVNHLTPDVRAVVARSATLSGYARALNRARHGFPADLEALNRGLGSLDELGRVVSHGVSTDSTLPTPLVGDIVRLVDASRPAITASNRHPMPGLGASFLRPRTTQPTLVGATGAEGNIPPSRRWQTTGDVVTKTPVGFVIALSEQELDMGGDFTLDSLATDVARSYAAYTAGLHCASIESAISASGVLSTTATSDVVMSTLAGAIPAFATAANNVLPDTLLMSTTRFAQLAALVDSSDRPVAPALIADALNVRLVVDPGFQPGTLALAASSYLEWFEPELPSVVRVGAPSTLEVVVSFSSSVASYVPSAALHGFTTS